MKKLFGFILVTSIIIALLNILALYSANYYKERSLYVNGIKREILRENILKYKKEKTNILFLGSSEVFASVIPEQFDSLLNYRSHSINMGLMGMPSDPCYFILKDYMEKNSPPEIIMMELNAQKDGVFKIAFDKYSIQGIRFKDELFSYLIHKRDKDFIINYLLPAKIYYKEVFSFLSSWFFNKEALVNAKNEKDEIYHRLLTQNGYEIYGEKGSVVNKKDILNFYKEKVDLNLGKPSSNYNIKKFFRLAEELGIDVYLFLTPKHELKYNKIIPLTYKKELSDFISNYNNVRLLNGTDTLLTYSNQYFYDENHVNDVGATKFTNYLAKKCICLFEKE